MPFSFLFRASSQFDDIFRHSRIDLFGERDELRIKSVLPRFPRKIMRVERDAVTADSRSRIKRHKAERFCRRRADNFPGVNAKALQTLAISFAIPILMARKVFSQSLQASATRADETA